MELQLHLLHILNHYSWSSDKMLSLCFLCLYRQTSRKTQTKHINRILNSLNYTTAPDRSQHRSKVRGPVMLTVSVCVVFRTVSRRHEETLLRVLQSTPESCETLQGSFGPRPQTAAVHQGEFQTRTGPGPDPDRLLGPRFYRPVRQG